MAKILRITAKRDGYRRCGVKHGGEATDHEIDAFSKKQVEILKADPFLVVQELELENKPVPPESAPGGPSTGSGGGNAKSPAGGQARGKGRTAAKAKS